MRRPHPDFRVNRLGLFKSIGKIAKGVAKAVPVVGDVISASDSKKATKKAAAAQIESLNNAIALLNKQFDSTSANYQPAITAGNQAIGGIGDLLGLGGAGQQQEAISALQSSPLYQSLFDTGRDTILGSASATGGLRGGNVNSALADFGRDTLAQTIQQQLSNLGGLASLGQNAIGNLGQLGAQNANSVADLTTGIGNVNAGSILGVQGIDNNLFSGLRQTVGSALGLPGAGSSGGLTSILGGGSGGLSSILGGGGLSSIFGNLFGGSGAGISGGSVGGDLSGIFPSIIGATNNPINLGTLDTTPLIQKIGF